MDIEQNAPAKKKRGRKPKSYYEELEKQGIMPIQSQPKEKKKRGRKPLNKNPNEEKKIPKKRGRKPKKTDYSIVDVEQVKFTEEEEDIILHIPIKINNETLINNSMQSQGISSNLEDQGMNNTLNDPGISNFNPTPYDDNILSHHGLVKETNLNLDYESILQQENIVNHNNNPNQNKVNQILVPFKNFNKNGKWPEQVNIYCWHCCHPFKTSPVSIPIRYIDDIFHVYGVFCSYNCAAAYNLNSNDYNKNERHQLLSLMYSKLYNTNSFVEINPAPPKEILQIFGGNVTIDNYRKNFLTKQKEFKLIKPPLISIIPQVEETRRKYKKKDDYIPINQTMVDNMNNNLRLKRNKNTSGKNTLIELMGLSVN
jgi:hypothetical protein